MSGNGIKHVSESKRIGISIDHASPPVVKITPKGLFSDISGLCLVDKTVLGTRESPYRVGHSGPPLGLGQHALNC